MLFDFQQLKNLQAQMLQERDKHLLRWREVFINSHMELVNLSRKQLQMMDSFTELPSTDLLYRSNEDSVTEDETVEQSIAAAIQPSEVDVSIDT